MSPNLQSSSSQLEIYALSFRGIVIALDGVKKDAFPNQDAPRQQRSQDVFWYPWGTIIASCFQYVTCEPPDVRVSSRAGNGGKPIRKPSTLY